jgi:beta-lactam-binding protein with PASTA domain
VIAIAVAFLFGLATTVYLSLRSREVTVPNIVGKDRFEAEKILGDSDLNFRVRAARPSNQVKPDTVLFQLPHGGEVVKAGQTVAMDISRAAKEGETPETVKQTEEPAENRNATETLANENKPKRNKNTNKNANDNSNANLNANTAGNANRHANTNAAAGTVNANATPRPNVNRTEEGNSNSRTNSNQNENRRPPAPKPSPTVRNANRDNPGYN